MPPRRPIDDRDVDRLLDALTDRQMASLFAMPMAEVSALRRERRMSRDDEEDGLSSDDSEATEARAAE